MVLASAAIPTLFKAVELDQTAYWDGLFSENPPVAGFLVDNVEERPDEIWIVRINPQKRSKIPMNAEDIQDRRNELAGNLALNQELRLIELVNQWIDRQDFAPNSPDQFKRIQVRFIDMSPQMSDSLDYASKLNRSPQFIQQLMADGEKQAEAFLQEKDDEP
jgi:NTE family protein